eukprot:gnl/MRDRNA2_/MRDRNA2_58022_c0_seq1.p1 gnl/MRDRNA2_/MRDRNA2_58022_c0~~gnl/MRDRNA2_/MRDRNA2_58022_c0_seq1.p1  ORF type:complete len:191 (+),score=38.56 gnl/MRDRNA2_/MRDRNA2_58022_c0_seq1:61-633(+)
MAAWNPCNCNTTCCKQEADVQAASASSSSHVDEARPHHVTSPVHSKKHGEVVFPGGKHLPQKHPENHLPQKHEAKPHPKAQVLSHDKSKTTESLESFLQDEYDEEKKLGHTSSDWVADKDGHVVGVAEAHEIEDLEYHKNHKHAVGRYHAGDHFEGAVGTGDSTKSHFNHVKEGASEKEKAVILARNSTQ